MERAAVAHREMDTVNLAAAAGEKLTQVRVRAKQSQCLALVVDLQDGGALACRYRVEQLGGRAIGETVQRRGRRDAAVHGKPSRGRVGPKGENGCLLMARNCHSCRAETGDTAGGEGWGGGPAQLAGCGTAGAACCRQLESHYVLACAVAQLVEGVPGRDP